MNAADLVEICGGMPIPPTLSTSAVVVKASSNASEPSHPRPPSCKPRLAEHINTAGDWKAISLSETDIYGKHRAARRVKPSGTTTSEGDARGGTQSSTEIAAMLDELFDRFR